MHRILIPLKQLPVRTAPLSSPSASNDDLLCFGTLEITDRDFGLWRQTMAVSDMHPLTAFHISVPTETLTDRVQCVDSSVLVTSSPQASTVRSAISHIPPSPHNDDTALGSDNS